MNWTPANIKTGIEYPAISDAEKAEWEKDYNINGGPRKRFRFKAAGEQTAKAETPAPKKEKTAEPVEAKRTDKA